MSSPARPFSHSVLARARVLRALLALTAAFVAVAPRTTHAQPLGDVVVVPYGGPDLDPAIQITPLLEAELANARFSLVSLHDARDRFAASSRPAALQLSKSDVDVLAQKAREAIEHVAFGRTAAAQKSVREVISRAERTLESLNRDTANARRVLDACLSLVRSFLQGDSRKLALEQATLCRRLVPDLRPAEDAHPANVVGVLAEADNLLLRMRTGRLTVHSTPKTGCDVYLNGRLLGRTPFHIDNAATGEYRVQVECGQNVGRVHLVKLGLEPVEITVDSDLDRAVASEPRLMLRYPDLRTARDQSPAHAAQVGRHVGVDDVLLVAVDAGEAHLLRVNVSQQRLLGRVQVPFHDAHGLAQPALSDAIEQLARGRDLPVERESSSPALTVPASEAPAADVPAAKPEWPATTPAPVAAPAGPADSRPASAESPVAGEQAASNAASRPSPRPSPRARRLRRAGLGLIGPAVALYALGVAAEWRAQHLEDDALRLAYQPPPTGPEAARERATTAARLDDLQSDYERARKLRWLGVGGSTLGAFAAGLLAAPHRSPPWWSYGLGVAGLGLIGAGAHEIAARERCALRAEDGMCRRKRGSEARGALLLSAAAPLLTVPVAQLLKARLRSASVLAGAAPTRDGLRLALHLTF